jgi:hypothetical protein
MAQLSAIFNAGFFIVSQVNPHIAPVRAASVAAASGLADRARSSSSTRAAARAALHRGEGGRAAGAAASCSGARVCSIA